MRRVALAAAVLPFLLGWTGYRDQPSGNWIRWYRMDLPVWVDGRGTDDVPGDGEFAAAVASEATWNEVADCAHPRFVDMGKSTGFLPGEPSKDTPETARNLVYWWYDQAEWRRRHPENAIALTTLYYEVGTGVAEKFDIELADFAYDFTVDGTGGTDVQNTLTHEFGHALGLDHSLDPEATMYFMAPAGDIDKRTLARDDIEGLCAIYAPVAALEPVDGGATTALDACCPWVVTTPQGGSGSGGGCGAGHAGEALATFALLLAIPRRKAVLGD